MSDQNPETSIQSTDQLLKHLPALQDEATLAGLADLLEKLAPVLQGRRLHNIVDLLAATSDVVEMTDDAMLQKLMALYEDGIGSLWMLSNALRYASAQAGSSAKAPTLWQSVKKFNQSDDARRGLDVVTNILAELGRQAAIKGQRMPED
ncbi:MAG: hypothetical protein M0Q98_01400 [Pseudomonas sp.]|jgi:hypothetical protein|nr:hypothetical protein [Pseudomonas sp.]MDY0415923.1 hypothetical protein [Pseudomonas sp.]NLO55378.1 DUF1641 domain-containing protein [Gammaproteobacteria bacterium]